MIELLLLLVLVGIFLMNKQSAVTAPIITKITGGELEQHGDCRREPQIFGAHLNAEAGGYFFIPAGSPPDTISIKMRGCSHSGIPDSDMCDNIHYLSYAGGAGKGVLGKQCPHLNYCWFGTPKFDAGDVRGKWIGMKCLQWNEGTGVHFQTWLQIPRGGQWRLYADYLDNGNTGCSGEAKPPFTKSPWKGSCPPRANFRIDKACNAQWQGLYLKDITPTAAQTRPPLSLPRPGVQRV